MGVGTTNKRVDRATKLMGHDFEGFLMWCYALVVDSGVSCYDGRIFKGFITFLRYVIFDFRSNVDAAGLWAG
jgi:hypothetical protein